MGKDKGILIVDDDDLVRETLVEVVKLFFDGNVFEATNGKEAFELFTRIKSKLSIITDVNMPVMDGFLLSEKIKEIDPTTKIMIISGNSENAKIHESKYSQFIFHSKPVDFEIIKTFLNR